MLADIVSNILQRALAGYTEDYKHHTADGRTYVQWGKVERDIRAIITRNTMPDLTTTQAAVLLDIRADSVKKLCQRGVLKGNKIGRDWMISPEEVERYKAERKPAGRPKPTA